MSPETGDKPRLSNVACSGEVLKMSPLASINHGLGKQNTS